MELCVKGKVSQNLECEIHKVIGRLVGDRSLSSLYSFCNDGGSDLNGIIMVFVKVIIRRWNLRIPAPDRSPALYT